MKLRPLTLIGLTGLLFTAGYVIHRVVGDSSQESEEAITQNFQPASAQEASPEISQEKPQDTLTIIEPPLAGLDQKIIEKVAPEPPAPEDGSLAQILSYHKDGGTARERVKALSEKSFTQEDFLTAYAFLETEKVPQNMSMQSYHWLINELMRALSNQGQGVSGNELTEKLAQLSETQERDAIVRDYALQHLRHLHERGQGNHAQKRQIEKTYLTALDNPTNTFAGTSLLALRKLHQEGKLRNSNHDLGNRAADIARNPDYTLANRITAMGLVTQLGSTQGQQIARTVLEDKKAPTLLKVSAISELSRDPGNKPLLEKLRYSSNTRLRTAALASLKKLSRR